MQITKTLILSIFLYSLSVFAHPALSAREGGDVLRIDAKLTIVNATDRAELKTLIRTYCNDLVIKERGTLGYEAWETSDPKEFAFIEAFTNDTAFATHRARQEASIYWAPLLRLVGGLNVFVYSGEAQETENRVPALRRVVWTLPGGIEGSSD